MVDERIHTHRLIIAPIALEIAASLINKESIEVEIGYSVF